MTGQDGATKQHEQLLRDDLRSVRDELRDEIRRVRVVAERIETRLRDMIEDVHAHNERIRAELRRSSPGA